ncbi:hypothetical protein AJ78_07349 [Emergomyces pasteurianus Ep9510]|uniref:Increased recombination centers protein 6 n=1 Tax=Emergomyces pasteurianus Ep9510 TaxID=1447872 RepID=A0A1J9Q701_9EURO|nr:hypothetical protein AJ78_07349 [Emergomyces pasteurianus Ep9510]
MPSPRSQNGKLPSNTKAAPRISSPHRLLILTPAPQSHTIIPPFLHTLTGVAVAHAPQATNAAQSDVEADSITLASSDTGAVTSTFAGYTTHSPLRIETKYYSADIPIWVDELPFPSSNTTVSSLSQPHSDESRSREADSQSRQPSHYSSTAWKSEFLSDEAREVRDVIGAVVVCIERPVATPSAPAPDDTPDISRDREHRSKILQGIKELLGAVAEVRNRIEEERGGGGEVPGLVVLVGRDEGGNAAGGNVNGKGNGMGGVGNGGDDGELEQIAEFSARWWEEELSEMGHIELEVVAWDPKGEERDDKRNIFGELQGMSRIREVLQTNEWASTGQGELSTDILLDSEGENGFDKEASELEREMIGLRLAIEKEGDQTGASEPDIKSDDENELEVEKLNGLMLRMQAIKDMAAELPEVERKGFAVKAINDIMKDI